MRIIGGLFSFRFVQIFLAIFFLLFISGFVKPLSVYAVDGEITYTGTNTNLIGDDSFTGPFNLGFTFNYYGTDYTQAYININGTVNFGAGNAEYGNSTLNSSGPSNTIYAFWDDLITDPSPYEMRPIYYATIGSAPNRKFVVQWTNVYFFSTTVQMGTFQAILYEGSNSVQIQYRDLLGGDRALGNSATIGIKKDGSTYKQYSANTASLVQGQSILYSPNGVSDFTVSSLTPGVGQEVSSGYDLLYLAPSGAPVSPTLVNPQNGATGTTTTPTFEWLPVDGATSYTVLVSTVSNFSSTVVNASGQTGTSYTLGSPLGNSTAYYWRVQSVNSYGSSLSSTRTFTTGSSNAAPNTPSNVSSSKLIGGGSFMTISGSVLTASLSDPDSGQQVRYRIQIATDNTFNTLAIDYRGPFASQGAITYTYGESGGVYLVGNSGTSLSPANYYLRIRAEDAASASSSWYTASGIAFVVAADTSAPEISSITSSPTSNSSTISWVTDENASSLVEYGLVQTYGFTTAESDTSPRVTSHSVSLSSLKACARYYYRVKSKDANNNQGVSAIRNFNTTGCVASTIERGEETHIDVASGGNVNITTTNSTAQLTVPTNFAGNSASFQINQLQDTLAPTPPTGAGLADGNLFDLIAVDTNDDQLSTFDQPITFTITYDASLEQNFVENTLDVYKYDGSEWIKKNCILDTSANTLTCTLNGFSVYGVIGTPYVQSSSTTSVSSQATTSSDNSTPVCSDEPPSSAPDLFQINSLVLGAKLHFSPISNTSRYYISYSTSNSAEEHGVMADIGSEGVQSFVVNSLLPSAEYYFKVRGQRGCMPGLWSNIKSVRTGNLAPGEGNGTESHDADTSITGNDEPNKVVADYISPTDDPENADSMLDINEDDVKIKSNILYILFAALGIFVAFLLFFIFIKRKRSKHKDDQIQK